MNEIQHEDLCVSVGNMNAINAEEVMNFIWPIRLLVSLFLKKKNKIKIEISTSNTSASAAGHMPVFMHKINVNPAHM